MDLGERARLVGNVLEHFVQKHQVERAIWKLKPLDIAFHHPVRVEAGKPGSERKRFLPVVLDSLGIGAVLQQRHDVVPFSASTVEYRSAREVTVRSYEI